MTESASRFLHALAQTFSSLGLYVDGHPARERAVDKAHERLRELQEEHPTFKLTILGEDLIFDEIPLREFKGWDWCDRLSRAGIQRVEIAGLVERDDFEVFLEEAMCRLSGTPEATAAARPSRPTNIRLGLVAVKQQEEQRVVEDSEQQARNEGRPELTMGAEIEAIEWIQQELKDGRMLPLLEAEALVRTLSRAMHDGQSFLMPLVHLKRHDEYTTTHALNVGVLSMALSEFIGLAKNDVQAFGISGVLHDLGKVKVPTDVLNKPGKLTPEERELIERHPVDGARMILDAKQPLDMAAVVAYEHHIRADGKGYPRLHYRRSCHPASDLVHVCDVYDALRTHRPYREAWSSPKVLGYIRERSGTEFDQELASAFLDMMEKWESQIALVTSRDQELPTAPPSTRVGSPATESPTLEGVPTG